MKSIIQLFVNKGHHCDSLNCVETRRKLFSPLLILIENLNLLLKIVIVETKNISTKV